MPTASARDVLAARVTAQQLDRGSGTVADTAVLDLGVQDTGPDGALWALAVRGVDVGALDAGELALAWTLRGAPHLYRRADLPAVATATAPFSEADAAKRVFDAARPLRAAGIPVLTALDTIAGRMREIVTEPTVKGEMSRRLSDALRVDGEPGPYNRFCVPCDAVHLWEQPFRLSALRAGLELQPGTSPPVLQPVPGLAPAGTVPGRLDVVRAYLHLLGPATHQHVAGYLDAPVTDVKAHWPEDAVEVTVDGQRRWLLADDVDRLGAVPSGVTRLLGPFDLFLQGRDRETIADPARRKELWPTLGRPGAVLAGGGIAGVWRPRKAGKALTVTVEPWETLSPAVRAAIGKQAERLAAFRGIRLKAVDVA
ncbi:crosslink repair DNA glycosylase YcaQ family protein [Geodermatophilus aquaeductus]|uniref:Winged helix DNA-binding domain-containing protein n=1 Tax=Geodermatophilus aquaeductus TaxID=1564161 RepID=A0A521BQW2_9ACTN|nr:winged helix DNA-binding domain-containing protein [Geodermatophilus aquaeductus]SMO49554.1 Winged helix DNA-binding domain-containing protein [Geodermatophilus aquaeductus]